MSQTKIATIKSDVKSYLLLGLTLIAALIFTACNQNDDGQTTILTDPEPASSVEITPEDWAKGNKDAKVILVEYSDLQCPACAAYYPVIKQLAEQYGNEIGIVYRHFPLRQIHKNADVAAQASEAAGKQGKFFEMHDKIFEKQEEWSKSDEAKALFAGYAEELGLNVEKFKTDLVSKEAIDKVEQDYRKGLRQNVGGTPSFFLNGSFIQPPRSPEQFQKIIDQALAATKSRN